MKEYTREEIVEIGRKEFNGEPSEAVTEILLMVVDMRKKAYQEGYADALNAQIL